MHHPMCPVTAIFSALRENVRTEKDIFCLRRLAPPDDLVLPLYGSYAAIFIRFFLSKAVTNLPHFFMPSCFSGM
jgi:hypothetical protein